MALKKSVTKAEYAKLPSDIQKEYVADGDNFNLDVEGGIDVGLGELKRAKDNEVAERKKIAAILKERETELETLRTEHLELMKGNIPKGDLAKIEKQYTDKIAKLETDSAAKVAALTGNLQEVYVDNVATTLAAKISTSPAVILPHIQKRLKAVHAEGKTVTKVLAKDGSDSIMTVEELEKEFIANKDFSAILIANRGSGSGGGGQGSGGAGAGNGKKIDLTGSAKDIVARMKTANLVPQA